jgi:glycosyltransferase involved in cell wall biosynthesis
MDKPLRILYHHRTQGRGAEAVHISSIVHALQAMGHQVDVLSPPGIDPMDPARSTPVDKAKGVQTGGVQSFWKLVSKHMPNFLFELAEMAYNVPAARRLREALARNHYDLVYERYAFYLVAGARAAQRAGVPFVLEANEVSGIADRARKQSYPVLCRRFERHLFARCTAIHTVSSNLKKMILAQGVPDAKVHVAPNAFNIAKVQGLVRDQALATQLGLDGRRVLGFAGWFDKWDRLDYFIEVFAQVKATHPQAALMLVGDGPVLVDARRAVAARGLEKDVVFTGAVPRTDVYRYLNLLDIAVLPHSNDFGSPVVMFEFMALKKPVVAPRLAPIEDVHRDGETALLFKPLDVAGCRGAIERLLADPAAAAALAARAYARLVERHTWHRNAELILESAALLQAQPERTAPATA